MNTHMMNEVVVEVKEVEVDVDVDVKVEVFVTSKSWSRSTSKSEVKVEVAEVEMKRGEYTKDECTDDACMSCTSNLDIVHINTENDSSTERA